MSSENKRDPLKLIGPGILVAATGVGAGDLATAAMTGGKLGVAVLWAVVVGAAMKYALSEGLARYQLTTGRTLIEGAVQKFGRTLCIGFLLYLIVWSFFTGGALMSAAGAAAHALIPLFDDATEAKVVFGIAQSLIGLALVWIGGFALFERVMSVCIGVMFVAVIWAAVALWPGTSAVLNGLFVPSSATLTGAATSWTVALIGGVGGTVTMLSYGYWIRESGRTKLEDLPLSRLDLALGYGMTALFGVAMIIVGSGVPTSGKGAALIVALGDRLEGPMGPVGRWAFLLGAWGAIFSSLLGVWQAVPYLFADVVARVADPASPTSPVNQRSPGYRGFLIALATVPMVALLVDFRSIQKAYAVVGALFVPLLAVALLLLNRRRSVGDQRNGPLALLALLVTLGFFAGMAWLTLAG